MHGITKETCAAGAAFNVAIAPILQVLRNGVKLVVHRRMTPMSYVVNTRSEMFLDAWYAGFESVHLDPRSSTSYEGCRSRFHLCV